MFDPNDLPYAEWLEKSLQNIASSPIQSICIVAKRTNGEMLTGYYNCSVTDKLLFAGYINQDAMMDSLYANGYISGEDDDEDDDEEDLEEGIYDE